MKSTTRAPESASACYQLAISQIAANQLYPALASLQKCLRLAPRLTAAHLRISAVYQSLGEIDKSDVHLKRVLKKEPRNTEALTRYANNRMVIGNTDKALEYFRAALKTDARATVAAAGLSSIYIRRGDFEKALRFIDPYLKQENVHETIAIAFSDVCHYANRCDEAIELLGKILKRPGLPDESRSGILFALAGLYDKQRRYDKAFETASGANRLKPVNFDPAGLSRSTQHYLDRWNTGFNDRLPVASVPPGKVQPVFIVGMPRSGTTLVEQILASHPAVFGAGELKHIGSAMMKLQQLTGTETPYPDYLEHADRQMMDAVASDYLDKLVSLSGGRFSMVTNKMPQNFWYLGLINALFPNAKIIHCKRNPLDTCISCYFTNFADGNTFSSNLRHLGDYFKHYTKIMDHWKNRIGVPMLDMAYEELVSAPETWSRRLVEYCGLDWDEKCLTPHKTRRDVVTASSTQIRERIYTSSIGRWKHYEKHIDALSVQLQDTGASAGQ